MSGVRIKDLKCDKDLGVTIVLSLEFCQHCKNVADESNRILGFININIFFHEQNINLTALHKFNQTPLGICSALLIA